MIAKSENLSVYDVPVNHRTVLVVDDNPDTTTTLSLLLKSVGYNTLIAHNGIDAVKAVRQFQPDAVLLDIGMPRMNGVDACKEIRQLVLASQPAVVAMTGYGSERDVEHCLRNGFDGHSVKGQEFSVLKDLLDKLLNGKRS